MSGFAPPPGAGGGGGRKTVRIQRPAAPPVSSPVGDPTAGWAPWRVLGAESPFGLALPSATPTSSQMYAPRAVWSDGERVIVADTGNHRVLIWHSMPEADGAPADVVIGQRDMTSEGPAANGRGPERGLHLPTGVCVIDGRLVVADAWHHRLVVFDEIPQSHDPEPDLVLGQASHSVVTENRGGPASRISFWWPYGCGVVGGTFWVADTGNRRVLGWVGGLPDSPDRPADVLLGQSADEDREENRGGAPAADSYRWPHAVAGTDDVLFVADAGNHRVVVFDSVPTGDRGADAVLGQVDASTAKEWPYGPQGPSVLRFPYGVAVAEVDGSSSLAVADTANNRILLWNELPLTTAAPADAVLGQPDFAANGENHWSLVEPDSMCWPYGLHMTDRLLAVADSGNNRVVIWRRG